MRKYLVSGVAAVALSWSMTLVAQPAGKPAASTTTSAQTTLNADQKSMYDSWPAEQRTSYDSWPADYRSYYWTLTPSQQSGWWRLDDTQRKTMYDMAPADRTTAWSSIEAQMAGAPAPSTSAMSSSTTDAMPSTESGMAGSTAMTPPAMGAPGAMDHAMTGSEAPAAPGMAANSGSTVTTYSAMPGPPPEAMNKTYPVCTAQLQDSCQNPGEGGAPRRRKSRR